jgi:extradiol dioxygenase family protein
MDIFHLAIPTHDLNAAEYFYKTVVCAQRARRYDDRVTFRFFDHQIVCHLAPDHVDLTKADNPFQSLYPRHFGITFEKKQDFEQLYKQCMASEWPHVKPMFERFNDLPEKHYTFFLADPSFNLLEFKYYIDPKYMY